MQFYIRNLPVHVRQFIQVVILIELKKCKSIKPKHTPIQDNKSKEK